MSHKATNWAIQQRGLDPAAKLVLWHLSDRHNSDTGRCDPSQDRLAYDAELSRSSINRKLRCLEEAGLIKRVQRLDPKTKKVRSTSYLLAMDNDFSAPHSDTRNDPANQAKPVSQSDTRPVCQKQAEPCVKSCESRVSNWDTNLVREPLREPVCGAEPPISPQIAFEEFWRIYPRPRDAEASEKAFLDAIAAGISAEEIVESAKEYADENVGNGRQYIAYSDNWLKDQRWSEPRREAKRADPSAEDCFEGAVRLHAKRILEGRKPFGCEDKHIHKMLELGLVSAEQIRSVGVSL